MRFWLALTLFVGGLVASTVGLVNQIENTPVDRISLTERLEIQTTYLFLPASLLSAYQAPVTVEARGADVFIASARDVDILGWLADSPFVELRLTVNQAEEQASLIELNRSGAGELSDPRGSDTWREEFTASGTLSIEPVQDGETGLLIAASGIDLAPRLVSIEWDLPSQAVPVAPVTYVGFGLMALGSLLGIWVAFDKWQKQRARRSGTGVRRPKRRPPRRAVSQAGPDLRRGRRAARPVAFIGAALLAGTLTGCTAEYQNPVLSPSPIPAPELITAAITKDQGIRILEQVAQVIATADENLDRESLELRVAGPALETRRFAYNLARRFEEEDRTPDPILSDPIQLFLPPATDTWPRTMVIVSGDQSPQLLILRQGSPRDVFKLYQYMSLLPEIEFPEVAAETVGASQLKQDSLFLKVSPSVLAEATGDLLNNGPNSSWAELIDPENQYIQDLSGVQRALVESLDNANLSFDHEMSDFPLVLVSTADGGALAGIYMIDTYTIIPREPGDAVAISGDEAVLLGSAGSATGIETRYGAMLLFHIPAAGSESPIRLLGATQQLLTAEILGNQ
jgi:hypothetical protein